MHRPFVLTHDKPVCGSGARVRVFSVGLAHTRGSTVHAARSGATVARCVVACNGKNQITITVILRERDQIDPIEPFLNE